MNSHLPQGAGGQPQAVHLVDDVVGEDDAQHLIAARLQQANLLGLESAMM
jgi:hypothetical protein